MAVKYTNKRVINGTKPNLRLAATGAVNPEKAENILLFIIN